MGLVICYATGAHGKLSDLELEAVKDASIIFNLDVCLIYALQEGEGGSTGFDTHHSNGSIDTGLAQIKKGGVWMDLLKNEYGIEHVTLRDNGAVNILSSAFILRTELDRTEDIILALSAYHRGFGNRFSKLGLQYSNRLMSVYKRVSSSSICKTLHKL